MKIQDLSKRVDELIQLSKRTLNTRETISGTSYIKESVFKEFRTATLSFILKTFGTDHPYYQDFDKAVSDTYPSCVEQGLGILNAIKNEIDGGWLADFKGLVTAEIFSDFLEMAEYLLNEKYKDAAAVMIGSVLEEHLRQLCIKNGITTEYERDDKINSKKADRLNSELAAANVYNKLDQKNITTQLDIRNKAAHGKYDEYSEAQVSLMLQSIIEFMSRVSV